MRWTVLTITLLAMTMFVVGLTQAAVSNDEPYDDIRLYFHSDGSDSVGQYNMSTWGPGSGDAGNINVGSGAEETRDYILNKSLQYDLVVIGKDLGGARGFRAIIIIDCDDIEPGDNTDAQVSVLEKRGTNETLVAESTRASHQTTWDIPFVESGMKRYTFRAGSEIIFRITVRSSATLGGTCSVGTNGDYYLNLTCSPVELRFNVNTYDYTDDGDHTGTGVDVFQVNLPYDIQYMNISGEVRNAFGSYDVQEVNLTLERIGTDPAVIFKDRTTIHLNSYLDDGVYRFFDQWFWPSNITPTDPKSGSEGYRLTMSFRNRDNVTFTNTNNSVHLDFLQYAVYMRFWDPVDQMWKEQIARTGEANSTLDVEVTVYNTGTDEETVNLDASNFKVA
ncbi:MAG TPA: hypothetical protein EYP43_01080, partial [Thermoplasmata archaeon]|nr:hypothetical protein [Thermoplasmata archaeon]